MTAITSRPVQAETPPDAKPVTTPPAAKTPEMVAPAPDVKPKPVPSPSSKPLEQSATKKPSTGPELKSGAARVVTPNAAQVPFGGLAERAGGSSAGGPQLDVANFCCPEYIETMTQRITVQLGPAAGRGGTDDREVHDSPGRHADQRRGREEQQQPAARSGVPARGAQHATASCPAGPVHSTDVDRVPQLRLQALMKSMKLLTSLFAVSAVLALAAQNPPPATQPQQQRPQSVAISHQRRSGPPAAPGGARVHPARQGAGSPERGEDHRRRAVGRLCVREGVLPAPPRHPADGAAPGVRRSRSRSIAGRSSAPTA